MEVADTPVLLLDEPLLWYPFGAAVARDILRIDRERRWRWNESPANICADLGHFFVSGRMGHFVFDDRTCWRCGVVRKDEDEAWKKEVYWWTRRWIK